MVSCFYYHVSIYIIMFLFMVSCFYLYYHVSIYSIIFLFIWSCFYLYDHVSIYSTRSPHLPTLLEIRELVHQPVHLFLQIMNEFLRLRLAPWCHDDESLKLCEQLTYRQTAWNDARCPTKCGNLLYAITYVIWANQKTESFEYHCLRALAMFDETSFPAILLGIGRQFKFCR